MSSRPRQTAPAKRRDAKNAFSVCKITKSLYLEFGLEDLRHLLDQILVENDEIGRGQTGNDANNDEDDDLDEIEGKLNAKTGPEQGC